MFSLKHTYNTFHVEETTNEAGNIALIRADRVNQFEEIKEFNQIVVDLSITNYCNLIQYEGFSYLQTETKIYRFPQSYVYSREVEQDFFKLLNNQIKAIECYEIDYEEEKHMLEHFDIQIVVIM